MSIEEAYKDTDQWDRIYAKVCEKAVIISFGDQDNAYPEYIAVNWPDIRRFYCVAGGIGYNSSNGVTVPYREYFRADWMTENIKFGHGALMAEYLLFGDGTYYEGEVPTCQFGDMDTLSMEDCWLGMMGGADAFNRYDFISEGDSPCWMFLIPSACAALRIPPMAPGAAVWVSTRSAAPSAPSANLTPPRARCPVATACTAGCRRS